MKHPCIHHQPQAISKRRCAHNRGTACGHLHVRTLAMLDAVVFRPPDLKTDHSGSMARSCALCCQSITVLPASTLEYELIFHWHGAQVACHAAVGVQHDQRGRLPL